MRRTFVHSVKARRRTSDASVCSRDPARGVVDPTLRVHGFDNLHVCDASVFPTAITVNPQ